MSYDILLSTPDVGELEERAIVSAFRSGWIAPLGPEVDLFEAEVAAYIGVDHGIALASGTAALHMGLLALNVRRGDIVLTSTMTFAATAFAITYTGAIPYFIDCLPGTGNMDPQLLHDALVELDRAGTQAAAIIPVDLLGRVADYSQILAMAEEFGVPVFADSAESMGAEHEGRAAGSFGVAAVLSFNGNKVMTTSGGGMLVTNSAQIAAEVRYLSTQAREPVVHYEHTHIGYNYRLSNLLAALGRAQLQRLDAMVAKRHAVRKFYGELFANIGGVEILGGFQPWMDNAWLSAVTVDPKETRWTGAQLRGYLGSHGIESRPLWKPMHLQSVFSGAYGKINGSAEYLFDVGVVLPSGSNLTHTQLDRIGSVITDFVGGG